VQSVSHLCKVHEGALCLTERLVLKALQWDLNLLTVAHFVEVVCPRVDQYDAQMEVMLKQCVFGTETYFQPSVMASALLGCEHDGLPLPCFKMDAEVLRCAELCNNNQLID
jgi:hypothetical protein